MRYLPAIGLLLSGIVALAVLAVWPAPDARQLAAVFPPQDGFEQIQARLSGTGMRVVRSGGFENIVIVDLGGRRGSALLDAGAWAIANAKVVGACLTPRGASAGPLSAI